MKTVLFFLFIFGISVCEADTLVVAAGENFAAETLGIDELRSVYNGKRFRLGNEKIILLNLETENTLRIRFEQKVLEENRDTLARNWLQAHYLGHRPPKVFKSPEGVAEFLTKVDNAIGYMDESTAQKYRLKILYRAKE